MSTIRIKIYVAHAYHPKGKPYHLTAFRSAVKRLVERARKKAQNRLQVRLHTEVFFELERFLGRLSDGIETGLRACDIAIADISDNEANVLYEIGFMNARRIPVLLLKSKKTDRLFPRPDDLGDAMVCYYRSITDIESKLIDDLCDVLVTTVSKLTIREHEVWRIWFSRSVENALIVAAPEPEPSKFASPDEKNYIYLDRFEDRDSLLELHGFLFRRSSWLRTEIITWKELTKNRNEENLIIIGGPGNKTDPSDGNKACALFAKEHGKSVVRYGSDCESLIVNGQTFRTKIDRHGRIIRDYGYFARFSNPFNPNSTVIMMNGIHTFGTLGATLVFSDHPLAHRNVELLLHNQLAKKKEHLDFEVTFPVNVHDGRAVCPKIDAAHIHFF